MRRDWGSRQRLKSARRMPFTLRGTAASWAVRFAIRHPLPGDPSGFDYGEWIVRGLGTRSVWRLLKTFCCGPVLGGGVVLTWTGVLGAEMERGDRAGLCKR